MKMKYALCSLVFAAALVLVVTGCGDSVLGNRSDQPPESASADSAGPAEEPAGVEESAEVPEQAFCPVMGGKVNSSIYTEYNGKRVYFCCPPCVKAFESDPEKYMKKLEEAQGTPMQESSESGK